MLRISSAFGIATSTAFTTATPTWIFLTARTTTAIIAMF